MDPANLAATRVVVLNAVSLTSSCLSMLGCIFILYTFILFRDKLRRQYLARLVAYLAFTDLVAGLLWVFNMIFYFDLDESPQAESGYYLYRACAGTGPIIFYAYSVSWGWIAAIATENARRYGFRKKALVETDPDMRFELTYHILVWCLPLVPFFALMLHPTTPQDWLTGCWVIVHNGPMAFVYASMLTIVWVYGLAACGVLVRSRSSYEFSAGQLPDDRDAFFRFKVRASLYLIVFLFCWSWYIVDFAIVRTVDDDATFKDDVFFAMDFVAATVIPLAGFFNSLIFGWNARIWFHLKLHARRMLSRFLSAGACVCCQCCPAVKERVYKGRRRSLVPPGLVLDESNDRAGTYYGDEDFTWID